MLQSLVAGADRGHILKPFKTSGDLDGTSDRSSLQASKHLEVYALCPTLQVQILPDLTFPQQTPPWKLRRPVCRDC